MRINQVQQYLVRWKIAFPSCTLENLPIHIAVKIVIEQFFFFQTPKDLVLPKQVPFQPMRLMNLKHKYNISQTSHASAIMRSVGLFLICRAAHFRWIPAPLGAAQNLFR
jgi:hypothetical protein